MRQFTTDDWILLGIFIVLIMVAMKCFLGVQTTAQERRHYEWLVKLERGKLEGVILVRNQLAAKLLAARILEKASKLIPGPP